MVDAKTEGWIEIAQRGFENWKAKPHNARWFRKIDGTPIPNDLTICIGEAFAEPLRSLSLRVEAEKRAKEEATEDTRSLCRFILSEWGPDGALKATTYSLEQREARSAKGGDANDSGPSRPIDATSPGVTAGASAGEDGELCKRLEATRDGIPFGWASSDGRSDVRTPKHLINPDGPEAAARIRALTAENEALRRERDEAIARVNLSKDTYQMHLKDAALAGARLRGDDAIARATASDALVAELREKVERLTKALEPFAKAASDYERQGEFFSDNVELVLRVSVFAAPEYHNSTAVQVGDLRRACTALEGHDNG